MAMRLSVGRLVERAPCTAMLRRAGLFLQFLEKRGNVLKKYHKDVEELFNDLKTTDYGKPSAVVKLILRTKPTNICEHLWRLSWMGILYG